MTNVFIKGRRVNPTIHYYNVEAVMGNMQTNESDCIAIELYLWALRCEFHVTLTSLKTSCFLFVSFQPFKNAKTILSSRAI